MSDEKKQKAIPGRSPRGVAVYPYLHEADTKYKAEGEFRIKLRLPAGKPETDAFVAKLDELHALGAKHPDAVKAKAKLGKKPLKEASLPYSIDEEEGIVLVTFKMKASFKSKAGKTITQRPALFDAKRKPLAKDVQVWGGSEVKVAFEAVPFFTAALGYGVSLRLVAVQVLQLQTGGRDAAGMFDDEDGFSAEDGEGSEGGSDDESGDSDESDEDSDDEAGDDNADGGDSEDF